MELSQAFAGAPKGIEAHVRIGFVLSYALEGASGGFHGEEIFVEEGQVRRQGQTGVDGHDLIGFAPEGRRRVFLGKGITAVAHAALDEIFFPSKIEGDDAFFRRCRDGSADGLVK